MTPAKPYRKQNIIDSFCFVTLINQILCKAQASFCSRPKVFHFLLCVNVWSPFIITMMSHFRPRRRNLETRVQFLRWGERSWGGGRSLLGLGRWLTYRNRYFLSDLIHCCQSTNDEKPALKSFPCTSYLFPIATSQKI